MSKEEKIMNKIASDLSQYTSYEEKHNYLQNHKYLPRVYEKYPNLKPEVNKMMLGNVIAEFGDELSDQFTFSKDVSNKEILRQLDLQDANIKYLENFEFRTESPELVSQLVSLNLIEPSNIEYDKDKNITAGTVRSVEGFDKLIELKNKEFKEVRDLKKGYRENIQTLRDEFDSRSTAFGGSLRKTPFPWIPEVAKTAMQLTAGWTDWFQPEGMERVENRMLNWDPINEKYGPGPEIRDEQEKLGIALGREDKLKDKFEGVDTKYEELNDLINVSIEREEKLQATGIDEALNYADIKSLRTLLGE
tara:strand:- start:35 stop:949 length:915 start_codon:yes stop_codon:yes gene_type:complete